MIIKWFWAVFTDEISPDEDDRNAALYLKGSRLAHDDENDNMVEDGEIVDVGVLDNSSFV